MSFVRREWKPSNATWLLFIWKSSVFSYLVLYCRQLKSRMLLHWLCGKMPALFLLLLFIFFLHKQSCICQLDPRVVSFQTVGCKISKWSTCSSLLFYNHINWQMSLGNREEHIRNYFCFHGVTLLVTRYHRPKRPSQQEIKLHSTQRVAGFFSVQSLMTEGPTAHCQVQIRCPVRCRCGEPYPPCFQVWFFNYHVVCTKALCQFNYCLINGVLQVYFRGLASY